MTVHIARKGNFTRRKFHGNIGLLLFFFSDTLNGTRSQALFTGTSSILRLYDFSFLIGAIRVWYEASTGNVTALQSDQSLATAGEDFIEGRRSIIIGDNVDVGSIPVLVIDDDVPELDQVFIVNITWVELVNAAQYNDTVPPRPGSHLVSQITLSANDDPYGVFKFPQAR